MISSREFMNRVGRILIRFLGGIIAASLFVGVVRGQEPGAWQIAQRVYRNKGLSRTILTSPVLNTIFFANDSNGCAGGDGGLLVCTNDGGSSWASRDLDSSVNITKGFFYNSRKGWAVGSAKGAGLVLSTADGGATWQQQYKVPGFELSGLHAVWFVDEQRGWIVGEAQQNGIVQGVILATDDGGVSWTTQYLGARRSSVVSAVKFLDNERGWAVGHNVILQTYDGGRKWYETTYNEGTYFFDLDINNSGQVWVAGNDGMLLRSIDYGNSWKPHQLPQRYQDQWLASVRFVGPTRGWVAGNDGTVFSTNDSGRTWNLESVGKSDYLRSLATTSHSIFAVGNGGVILRRNF